MKPQLVIFLSALLCVLGGRFSAAEPRPHNVLLLLADQHNADVMGCAGHPIVKNPYLDQLAEWAACTPEDGNTALSASPAEPKRSNRNSK